MNTRLFGFLGVLIASLVPVGVVGQSWTPPRTADSQPDLQGIWTNGTATPLERPSELAGKEFLTEQEAAVFEKQTAVARNSDRRARRLKRFSSGPTTTPGTTGGTRL